jgi:hypothetical protein
MIWITEYTLPAGLCTSAEGGRRCEAGQIRRVATKGERYLLAGDIIPMKIVILFYFLKVLHAFVKLVPISFFSGTNHIAADNTSQIDRPHHK